MNSEKIPSALSPYLRLPPEASLALVTSTLNTTANWVLLRYLYAALGNHNHGGTFGASLDLNNVDEKSTGVVLVSWMRDLAFWKTEARRALGIDLARLQQQGRFAFVDGLTSLFAPPSPSPSAASTSAPQTASTPAARSPLPSRSPIPTRGPQVARPPPSPTQAPSQSTTSTSANASAQNTHTLTNPTLAAILSTITTALSTLSTPRTLLILDTPSLLLSSTAPSITAAQLTSFLLTLRAQPHVHATVIALPADGPFLAAARGAALAQLHGLRPGEDTHDDPLARENAAFMVSCVQMARWTVSCRMLGTGWAEDVSGVVRVTRGGRADEDLEVEGEGEGQGDDAGEEEVKEGEWLYYVGGDGGVRVWGRGESGR